MSVYGCYFNKTPPLSAYVLRNTTFANCCGPSFRTGRGAFTHMRFPHIPIRIRVSCRTKTCTTRYHRTLRRVMVTPGSAIVTIDIFRHNIPFLSTFEAFDCSTLHPHNTSVWTVRFCGYHHNRSKSKNHAPNLGSHAVVRTCSNLPSSVVLPSRAHTPQVR